MNKEREHRRIWSQQQDEVLRSLVQKSVDPDKPRWKQISDQLNNILKLQLQRNPKQCRERWYNSLAVSQRQTKEWGIQDDVKLIQACKKHGHRWSKLAKQFDHKVNDNRLKNHFYSTLRKIVRVINAIVKQSKKQYQKLLKTTNIKGYTCQQLQILKQVSKLRSFEAKLLSKVFSLIDDKQEYKYQAKCSLEVEQVKTLNDEILDYMQDYVTGNNQFSNYRILAMIVKIMHVNRTIKTKYVRQVKLSIQDEQQIQKAQQIKKKRQKKINNIVKQELDNKIIPDRKTKAQIISKIKDQNKKLKKLMSPLQKKTKRLKKAQDANQIEDQNEQNNLDSEQQMVNYMQSQNEKQSQQQMFQQKQNKEQVNNDLKQQEYDKVSCLLNLSNNYHDNGAPANGTLNNSDIMKNGFEANKQKNLHSPSFNISSLLNPNNYPIPNYGFNNISYVYDQWDKSSKNLQHKNQSSQIKKQINKQKKKQQQIKPKQNTANQNPFTSNFLNDIPLFTPDNNKNYLTKKVQPQQDFRQIMNPFFPQHKLTQSQGYFIFQPPQPQLIQNHQNQDLFKSNPILGSLNFLEARVNEDHGMNEGDSGPNRTLRNSRIFQGLFASLNYSSNNDKGSQQSERMRNLTDLIPNFNPMHTSAFNPVQNQRQSQQLPIRHMEVSRPLSTNLNDHYGIRYNLMQSQPFYLQMYRSSQLHPDSNHSNFNLYHSYSYGQQSQQNKSKSNRSKSKKNKNQ